MRHQALIKGTVQKGIDENTGRCSGSDDAHMLYSEIWMAGMMLPWDHARWVVLSACLAPKHLQQGMGNAPQDCLQPTVMTK